MASNKEMICRACGRQGPLKKKGSPGLEIVLWIGALAAFLLMFPFGGLAGVIALAYSWWRASAASRAKACPGCQREGTLIPLETPEGKRIAASYTTPPIVKR
jgi:hypothetical protein